MKHAPALVLAVVIAIAGTLATPAAQQPPAQAFRFEISVAFRETGPRAAGRTRAADRVARTRGQEPRFQVGRGLTSAAAVRRRRGGTRSAPSRPRRSSCSSARSMTPSAGAASFRCAPTWNAPPSPAIVDAGTRGWPLESITQIPAGDYTVQAVLNVYTTFTRADGHTIKAHMDQWEGQHWNRSPGNLYSDRAACPSRSGVAATGSQSCSTSRSRRSIRRPTRNT